MAYCRKQRWNIIAIAVKLRRLEWFSTSKEEMVQKTQEHFAEMKIEREALRRKTQVQMEGHCQKSYTNR